MVLSQSSVRKSLLWHYLTIFITCQCRDFLTDNTIISCFSTFYWSLYILFLNLNILAWVWSCSPQHLIVLQMVYVLSSIFHTEHIHNSKCHCGLNTSYNVVPIQSESFVNFSFWFNEYLRGCPLYWYLPLWCIVISIIN